MHERIRRLRKLLDLTQQQFADRISVKRNTVATYEMGRSEPSEAGIALICREFDVNEEWLRTGNGEMFRERSEEEEIAGLAYGLLDPKDNDFYIAVLELLRTYKELTPSSQQVIVESAKKFMENLGKRKGD